ncbi:19369_t:CDS:2 [Rhizophagus irregularis]|nr:19369_t:CDS:2 [Rhizophagus irregularis]
MNRVLIIDSFILYSKLGKETVGEVRSEKETFKRENVSSQQETSLEDYVCGQTNLA